MYSSEWKASLQSRTDVYQGLHLTLGQSPSVAELAAYLQELEESKQFKTIWLELTTSHLPLLDLCTNKLGYQIHQGLGKNIVIFKWLLKRSNKLVPYSLFWVAAGALVIHDNKVLLVQEKGGGRKGRYGLPGGRADPGELISQVAERELFEETGIRANFKRIIMIRELTKDQIYGCVDIYFICLMDIAEGGLDSFKLCEREISNFAWVPLTEIEQFCEKNSVGTQIVMSKQVALLYRQNRLYDDSRYQKDLDVAKNSCIHRL